MPGGTQRVVVESFTDSYAFSVECGDFGEQDFTNEVEGTLRFRMTDVLSRDGELIQTVLHVVFHETDTNAPRGRACPEGAVHEVWDYGSNTRTLSGAVYVGTKPGTSLYLQDTGRITMTLDTREALFVAGRHEGFFDGVDNLVRVALAQP